MNLDTKYEQAMGSESFYVAISRARHEARLYVDNQSHLAVAVGRPQQKQYALEAMTLGLAGRSQAGER